MLTINCPERFQKVLQSLQEQDKETPGILSNFAGALATLSNKCLDEKGYDSNNVELGNDWDPFSFGFSIQYEGSPRPIVGGMIYNEGTRSWGFHT